MTYSEFWPGLRGLALLAALSAAATLAAVRSADAMPGYNGVCSVVIITKEGICDYVLPLPDPHHQRHLRQCRHRDRQHHRQGRQEWRSGRQCKRRRQDCDRHRPSRWESGGGSWSGGNGACKGVWQAERRS